MLTLCQVTYIPGKNKNMSKQGFEGEALRRIRLGADYTQVQLAKRLGVTRETISAIENERIGTIESLDMLLVKRWLQVCRGRLKKGQYRAFVGKLLKYFNIHIASCHKHDEE